MNISVFGTGYVGLVTGASLAEAGNIVYCVDVDEARIQGLQKGVIPIYEPGLEQLVVQNSDAGRLFFTTDARQGVEHGRFIFIAVGTPPLEDGSSDLRFVRTVATSIGQYLNHEALVVNKSTVPVGTADLVRGIVQEQFDMRGVTIPFDVVSNPEFLKEGAAIRDFQRPDRIVVGAEAPEAIESMRQLYAPFNRNHNRFMAMDTRSAELTKYAANAMLAAKISFMNEIANIADRVGADVESVRIGIGSDSRIGYDFIYSGVGYGGSCFPKDVRSLVDTAQRYGYDADLIAAIEDVNQRQKHVLVEKILKQYDGNIAGKTFAMWGLAFKPNTDDMRDAPSLTILDGLIAHGANVRAFDPEAMENTRRLRPDTSRLTLVSTPDEAIVGADALVIVTEWRQFNSPNWARLRTHLTDALIFDGRNMFDPKRVLKEGFTYIGIGVGSRVNAIRPMSAPAVSTIIEE